MMEHSASGATPITESTFRISDTLRVLNGLNCGDSMHIHVVEDALLSRIAMTPHYALALPPVI